jgi:hypothetical protein
MYDMLIPIYIQIARSDGNPTTVDILKLGMSAFHFIQHLSVIELPSAGERLQNRNGSRHHLLEQSFKLRYQPPCCLHFNVIILID